MLPEKIHAQQVLQLLKQLEIYNIIISPGSRNAPLTLGFTRDPFFNCYSIVDERCAAHVGLGMSQQTNTPTVLVCTSGSALLNYYPAVTEAFYSQIPLIVLSADRPPHKIDIGDGQTIRQQGVYDNHILYQSTIHMIDDVKQQELIEENTHTILTAINTAIEAKGPVHINVPFEEPLYNLIKDKSLTIHLPKISNEPLDEIRIDESFLNDWGNSHKKLIILGTLSPGMISKPSINELLEDPSVVILSEVSSNIVHPRIIWSVDTLIAPVENNHEVLKELQPEIVITVGGMIVSKKIKQFLRKYPSQSHYHVGDSKANDVFGYLKSHIKLSFDSWVAQLSSNYGISRYQDYVSNVFSNFLECREGYLKQLPWSDFKVFEILFKNLPHHIQLQLGNSSTIRYAQLFPMKEMYQVFSNRGTSGIDGSTSTAIGAAIASDLPTVFITGDLSFFYDSNALWNNYIPDDFKIILINNNGGGIFRILPGDKESDTFEKYFETTHELDASHLCKMHQIGYQYASNENEFNEVFKLFMNDNSKPQLLELHTHRRLNDTVLLDYFKSLKNK